MIDDGADTLPSAPFTKFMDTPLSNCNMWIRLLSNKDSREIAYLELLI